MGCRTRLGAIRKNVSGNAAVLLALALVPILSVAGFAIDHNRHVSAQHKIQASLDAAALATALQLNEEKLEESDLDPIAQAYFDTQLETNSAMSLLPVDAKIVGDEVILSVSGTLETSLMAVIGQRTMPLGADTAVVYNIQQPVELALVVDMSGSMSGSKLTALKDAAKSLTDILLPEDAKRDDDDDDDDDDESSSASKPPAKMSIIPFNNYVKIDTKYKNASWIRDTDPYTRTWKSCRTTNRARRDAGCRQETYSCTKWRGSVEKGNRESYRGTCKRWKCPSGAKPKETCTNRSEYRKWHGCVRSRKAPYNVQDDSYASHKILGIVQKNACSVSRTLELTTDHDAVDGVINSLKASNETYIPTGLIWGLRSLSPQAPFTDAEDYADFVTEGGRKALMLMSDGANTVSPNNSGWHNKRNRTQANQYTLDVCTEAKNEGVEVYTIAFDLDDAATKNMLKQCASGPNYYYDASNATELKSAFDSIGRDLADLAIAW